MRKIANILLNLTLIVALIWTIQTESEYQESISYEHEPVLEIKSPMRIVNTSRNIPRTAIVHETANTNHYADARWHSEFLDTTTRKVTWHYTVDDKTVLQTYPDSLQGWHAGECNTNSIGIELCVYSGIDRNRSLSNLDWLLRTLRGKYPGINIKKHRDCARTLCPAGITDAEFETILSNL